MADIKLIQKPNDPTCLRLSIGGTKDVGFYCVFRGDKSAITECLEEILQALKSGRTVQIEGEDGRHR
jgi:hypothetical protein